ncbi:Uncharacterised protein [[Eubacterium] contortum]|uniref:Uncharacterized protein n=1 Tax=Faecalicatena contorta TaxID=39482 RepID=A0A174GW89_9FIRM|nr:Uncharacterised protein [[Eubacterium] contortum] [Faecalicatena contorta]
MEPFLVLNRDKFFSLYGSAAAIYNEPALPFHCHKSFLQYQAFLPSCQTDIWRDIPKEFK